MTFPQGRRKFVYGSGAAALLFVCGACKSTTADVPVDPYDAKGVVIKAPSAGAGIAAGAATRAAQSQLELDSALAAWRAGDALTALAIANHALIAGVPSDLDAAFRDLRAKARAAVVATKICRIRALPEKDAVADGSPIPVRLEFANLANDTVYAPRTLKDSSDAVVVLTLVREDFDVYGNARSSLFTLPVPTKEDLVLPPGATRDTRLTIPAEMAKLTHEGFSVISVKGSFRPVVLQVGGTEFFDEIPIEQARVRVFMKGYEPLAADPLGSLKKAVAKRSPPHILTAVELLAPADRAEAQSFLEAAKAKDADLAQVIDASLARIASAR